jgi:threonine/homoserine/homoserine lactone efflux protein
VETGLTFASIAALFGFMLVGALVPSVSVLTVSARTVAFGFVHGVFTTLGIVAGDVVFILLAIYGLSALAELLGGGFVLVRYLGGAYLVWLGILFWRSKTGSEAGEAGVQSSLLSSFMTGLSITLGDQKAILFYLGFLPAFVDLSAVSLLDTGIIAACAVVAVGAAKLGYAAMSSRAGAFLKSARAARGLNLAAGVVMIGVGIFLWFGA